MNLPTSRDPESRFLILSKFLLALALIEASAGVWTLVRGPFSFSIMMVPVRSADGWKALTIGIWGVAASAWLRDRSAKAGPDSQTAPTRHRWAIGAVVVMQLLFSLPIALPGFAPSHDATAHLTNSYLFHRALEQGQFPVRWVEWITPGNGQPLFSYYQVGFYYLVEIVRLAIGGLTTSVKVTLVAIWAAGAIFCFRSLRHYGFFAAAAAAVLFSSSSYILLDVYVRAALPELTAIVAFAGLLWTVSDLTASPRAGVALAHAALVALMLTAHLPTSVIVAPVLVGFALVKAASHSGDRRGLVFVFAGTVLGAGMTAFYVLPAIGELELVKIQQMASGDFDYHQHFLTPRQWFNSAWGDAPLNGGAMSPSALQISPIQWIAAALAALMLVFARGRRRSEQVETLFWLAVFAGGAVMTSRWSLSVWEALPLLAFVQFPWRFLMLPAFASIVLIAFFISRLQGESTRTLAFVSVVLFQMHMTQDYRTAALSRTALHADVESDAWWQASSAGQALAFRQAAYDPIGKADDAPSVTSRWSAAETSAASVRVVVAEDSQTMAVVDGSEPSVVRVAIPFFPGWRTYVDRVEVRPSRLTGGYLGIDVPAGRHTVEARFTNTSIRSVGNAISAAAVACWVLALLGVIIDACRSRVLRSGSWVSSSFRNQNHGTGNPEPTTAEPGTDKNKVQSV